MYYLATNETTVFHYGKKETDQTVTTGQPKLLFFDTEEELIEKLAEYGQEYLTPEIDG